MNSPAWVNCTIIKLINSVAEVLNKDPDVHDLLKVVFLPNYNVKQAQWIYPARVTKSDKGGTIY